MTIWKVQFLLRFRPQIRKTNKHFSLAVL